MHTGIARRCYLRDAIVIREDIVKDCSRFGANIQLVLLKRMSLKDFQREQSYLLLGLDFLIDYSIKFRSYGRYRRLAFLFRWS
jgi:hypothetical protein